MRFPFTSAVSFKEGGSPSLMPFLPLYLGYNDRQIKVHGMLDTGASVNVLPFSVGLDLGAVWENQTVSLQLGGNLAATEARGLLLDVLIEGCPPTTLAFAWSRNDDVPVLLGQTNFFAEFDVLFSRSALFFDVSPKGKYL
jgi:hypothetical protein